MFFQQLLLTLAFVTKHLSLLPILFAAVQVLAGFALVSPCAGYSHSLLVLINTEQPVML